MKFHQFFLLASCGWTTSCAQLPHQEPKWEKSIFTARDGKTYATREWGNFDQKEPKVVLLGVHGISGESKDYEGLGNFIQKQNKHIGVVSYNLRGQGREAKASDKGDISAAKLWQNDLLDLAEKIQLRWPKSKLVLMGESLGSLIASQTISKISSSQKKAPLIPSSSTPNQTTSKTDKKVNFSGLILSSPIPGYGNKIGFFKRLTLKTLACITPKMRFKLEDFGEPGNQKIVEGTDFKKQAAITPWNVPSYSLRMLSQIDSLISQSLDAASQMTLPVLVLHGGKDIFCDAIVVEEFYSQIPETTQKQRNFYPNGHHLLMYDTDKEKIFRDITHWIEVNFLPKK